MGLGTGAPAELLGTPVANLALAVSLLSFCLALAALIWQFAKHFLDGGRVRVYLNTAVLQPEFMIATNRSGRFEFQEGDAAREVTHGRALELAQLVVENPGRVPVTIYSPGVSVSGHGKRDHTISPRSFSTEGEFGADEAINTPVTRLEPYGRVTFLMDYWSVVPALLKDAPKDRIFLRGSIGVAGRARKTYKSSWRLRWRITSSNFTAIAGAPKFTPFAVMWRAMYPRLPERAAGATERHAHAGRRITRGMLAYVLDEAMSRFDARPELEQMQEALDEVAQNFGDHYPMVRFSVFEAYQALDRMDDHLTEWTGGLLHRSRHRTGAAVESGAAEEPHDGAVGVDVS